MSPKFFIVTCTRCGGNEVVIWSGFGGEIFIACNDCDNEEEQ